MLCRTDDDYEYRYDENFRSVTTQILVMVTAAQTGI